MRRLTTGLVSTAVLILLLGTGSVAYAQKEEHGHEAKPAQPQAHPAQQHQQAQHAQKQQPQAHPAQQHRQAQHAQKQQPQAHPAQHQQAQHAQKQQPQAHPAQHQQAQHAQKQQPQAHPAQHQQTQHAHQQQPQAHPAQHQQAQHASQRASYAVPQRTQQQARGWQEQRGWQHGGGWQGNVSWQQNRAQNWQVQHRTWDQRGGYGGYYIPQESFFLSFGSDHFFRIHNQLIIVGGYPRFQYGGFAFMLVDPWPEAWPEDWYAADDVYVGYNNGYYLYNRSYPSEGIAISVVL